MNGRVGWLYNDTHQILANTSRELVRSVSSVLRSANTPVLAAVIRGHGSGRSVNSGPALSIIKSVLDFLIPSYVGQPQFREAFRDRHHDFNHASFGSQNLLRGSLFLDVI